MVYVDSATNRLLVSATFSGTTVSEYAEDGVHTSGDLGVMALAVRQDTQVDFAADGDYVPLSIDANGALRVTGGTEYNEDDATPATIVGKATLMERDDALSTLTPVEGDWVGLRSNSKGALWVTNEAVVAGEMVVAQGTASSLNAQVVGNIAHDAAVSGNPVQIAGEARSTERAAVANADVSRLVTDLTGKLITLPYANPEIFLRGREETTLAAGTNRLIAAQGASTRIYVTSLIISNISATNTEVNIQEGGSTILATFPAPTVGGAVLSFPVPIRLTENEALGFSAIDAVSTITVTALGYSGV